MKKKQLEIQLESLESFPSPVPELEQYSTPAPVAAEMLYLAHIRGELNKVCDLGCGTGILAIGAALLGARVIAIEIDSKALAMARKNAEKLGVDVNFVRGDVASIEIKGIETVIMNPPFGAQKSSVGDRPFLNKAIKIAKIIYTIHNVGSESFIKEFVKPCQVEMIYRIPISLKRCFQFHSKDLKIMQADLYRIVCD
ncbi:MAG: METTL5 family protein [Methanotrichaceae archaeon]|nr:METTL5 family protein [Methanotrichaceae archaeon]